MLCRLVDTYNYLWESDKRKNDIFQNQIENYIEKNETKNIRKRIENYFKIIGQSKDVLYCNVFYLSEINDYENGYYCIIPAERGYMNVYYYGKTEEEAFFNVLIDSELYINTEYEFVNREKLNKEYCNRFLNGIVLDDVNHVVFFRAELSLKDFRKYYGDNIPVMLIQFFEHYVEELTGEKFKYDYETNGFIKNNDVIKKKKIEY